MLHRSYFLENIDNKWFVRSFGGSPTVEEYREEAPELFQKRNEVRVHLNE